MKTMSSADEPGDEENHQRSAEMDRAMRELAEIALRFPFRWFPQGKVARICGFGDDVMTMLAAQGAPVVARKCNPHLLHRWLEDNIDRIGKIRP